MSDTPETDPPELMAQPAMVEPCQQQDSPVMHQAPNAPRQKSFSWAETMHINARVIQDSFRIPESLLQEDFSRSSMAIAQLAQTQAALVHEAMRQKVTAQINRVLEHMAAMAQPPMVVIVETPAQRKMRFLRELRRQRQWVSPRLAKRIRASKKALANEKAMMEKINAQIREIKQSGRRAKVLILQLDDARVERTAAGHPVAPVLRFKPSKRLPCQPGTSHASAMAGAKM